jgi:hypothetical protein
LIGLDRWHVGTKVVARLSVSDKIDLLSSILFSSRLASGSDMQQKWLASFQEIVAELKSENARRNKLVHSLYLFDFIEIGHPVMRSKRTRRSGSKELDQEYIDENYAAEAAEKVAELCFDVGMVRRQLIAWENDAVTNSDKSENKDAS